MARRAIPRSRKAAPARSRTRRVGGVSRVRSGARRSSAGKRGGQTLRIVLEQPSVRAPSQMMTDKHGRLVEAIVPGKAKF